jgi:hypothetical protein
MLLDLILVRRAVESQSSKFLVFGFTSSNRFDRRGTQVHARAGDDRVTVGIDSSSIIARCVPRQRCEQKHQFYRTVFTTRVGGCLRSARIADDPSVGRAAIDEYLSASEASEGQVKQGIWMKSRTCAD